MAQARPDRKPHSSADECLLTVSYVIHCLIIVMEMMMIMMKVMMRTPMNTDQQLSDSANHISAPPLLAWLICQTPLLAWQPNPDFVDLLLGWNTPQDHHPLKLKLVSQIRGIFAWMAFLKLCFRGQILEFGLGSWDWGYLGPNAKVRAQQSGVRI